MKGIFSPVDNVREPPVPPTGEDVREPPLPSNNGSEDASDRPPDEIPEDQTTSHERRS